MELLNIVIWGIAVFTVLGLVFGFALAATARKFHVAVDPLIEQVRDNLPSANCGACGYAGCQSYAEAVVGNPDVKTTLCTPGGKGVAEAVAKITGKEMGAIQEKLVLLRCHGTSAVARQQAQYEGIPSCNAAMLAFGGPKACKNGCLGLGDCERICAFDAIHVDQKLGIVVVDDKKCTGCGVCVGTCPKSVLELYPKNHRVELACVAKDKSAVVRPTCLVGCTTCRRCVAACPAKALSWNGKTILIDHEKCIAFGASCEEVCVDICPTSIMHRKGQRPVTEDEKKALKAAKDAAKAAEKPAAAETPST